MSHLRAAGSAELAATFPALYSRPYAGGEHASASRPESPMIFSGERSARESPISMMSASPPPHADVIAAAAAAAAAPSAEVLTQLAAMRTQITSLEQRVSAMPTPNDWVQVVRQAVAEELALIEQPVSVEARPAALPTTLRV